MCNLFHIIFVGRLQNVNPEAHEYTKVTGNTTDAVQQTKMFEEFARMCSRGDISTATYWPQVYYYYVFIISYL